MIQIKIYSSFEEYSRDSGVTEEQARETGLIPGHLEKDEFLSAIIVSEKSLDDVRDWIKDAEWIGGFMDTEASAEISGAWAYFVYDIKN